MLTNPIRISNIGFLEHVNSFLNLISQVRNGDTREKENGQHFHEICCRTRGKEGQYFHEIRYAYQV